MNRLPKDSVEVMIIAGEVSGDQHAAGLVREFTSLMPGFHFFGVGGDCLAEEGCENLFHVQEVAFLGFTEVIRHLPFIRKIIKRLLREYQRRNPAALVLVDYPGFNLRFAERVRSLPDLRHIPMLYYISPQVWAWHASRVNKIAQLVDRIAVIFDFEAPIYERAGLKADFVGHPILESNAQIEDRETFRRRLNISQDTPMLALLPGSREQEIRRLFPIFLRTYRLLKQKKSSLKAIVACSPAVDESLYRKLMKREGLSEEEITLLYAQITNIQSHSDVALVASGTATLETAIRLTPMVMAYKVSPVTYWIGKSLIKIPNIALVNVVAGKKVIPEFIQQEANPKTIAEEIILLLDDPIRRQKMIEELAEVKKKLGEPGASKKTAKILSEMIQNSR